MPKDRLPLRQRILFPDGFIRSRLNSNKSRKGSVEEWLDRDRKDMELTQAQLVRRKDYPRTHNQVKSSLRSFKTDASMLEDEIRKDERLLKARRSARTRAGKFLASIFRG